MLYFGFYNQLKYFSIIEHLGCFIYSSHVNDKTVKVFLVKSMCIFLSLLVKYTEESSRKTVLIYSHMYTNVNNTIFF